MLGKKKEVNKKREGNRFEKCCDCGVDFEIKYNRGTKTGSQKNNMGFGTRKLREKDKYKCDNCWLLVYYKKPQDFVDLVSNAEDRNKFLSYVSGGGFGELEETKEIKK